MDIYTNLWKKTLTLPLPSSCNPKWGVQPSNNGQNPSSCSDLETGHQREPISLASNLRCTVLEAVSLDITIRWATCCTLSQGMRAALSPPSLLRMTGPTTTLTWTLTKFWLYSRGRESRGRCLFPWCVVAFWHSDLPNLPANLLTL